jgi:hypothetical protein
MERDQQVENLVTWFFMFAGFMSIIAWGSMTLEFDKKCEDACAPSASITPLYELRQSCFCDEGHGKWRREFP